MKNLRNLLQSLKFNQVSLLEAATVECRFLAVLDYANAIHIHAAAHTLKLPAAVHQSCLRFITGDLGHLKCEGKSTVLFNL